MLLVFNLFYFFIYLDMFADFESESSQLKQLVEKLGTREFAAQSKLDAASDLLPRIEALRKNPDYLSGKTVQHSWKLTVAPSACRWQHRCQIQPIAF